MDLHSLSDPVLTVESVDALAQHEIKVLETPLVILNAHKQETTARALVAINLIGG